MKNLLNCFKNSHGYRYETNELKDNNTQPLNGEQK